MNDDATVGLKLLAKIVTEGASQEFGRVKGDWMYGNEELGLFVRISNYFSRYGVLPDINYIDVGNIPGDVSSRPLAYWMDAYTQRALTNQVGEVLPRIRDYYEKGQTTELLDSMRDLVLRHDADAAEVKEMFSMEDLGTEVLTYVDRVKHTDGIIGVPSGWPSLDNTTAGFHPGDIYVILARPKKGKSISIIYMANYAYELGYRVMLVSMEMRALANAKRLMAMRAGISMDSLKKGIICSFGEEKLRDSIESLNGRQFYYVEGQLKKKVSEIASLVYTLKPDVLFIDGGYLIKYAGQKSAVAKWEKITEVIEELKALSMVGNVPLVVSFQFNRQLKKSPGDAGFENIQLSDAIGQIASVGIGIFEDADPRRRRISVIGGREGEEANFLINWNWKSMDFTEITGREICREER